MSQQSDHQQHDDGVPLQPVASGIIVSAAASAPAASASSTQQSEPGVNSTTKPTSDESARKCQQTTIQDVVALVQNNVSVRDKTRLEFKTSQHGNTVIMIVDFSRMESVLPHHICPNMWKLSPVELAYVESSAYDASTKTLRIYLTNRDGVRTPRRMDPARRSWEELVQGAEPVNPSEVVVNVAGTECLGAREFATDFVQTIARDVIAAATIRGPMISANVSKFVKSIPPIEQEPDFILSITGLRVVGPKALDPKKWGISFPQDVREMLRSKFRIPESEHRTGFFISALDAFRNSVKEEDEDDDSGDSSKKRRRSGSEGDQFPPTKRKS